ncbi:MAG: hypothetical protein M0R17_02955 [Candidatus Omnitrophica bacterium]|jgi:hypothetical protein|nr:hypothetical protein [Candidatus Omnitrophota bacterium]
MIKTKQIKLIDCSDFDDLVSKTYNRPYNFQQQDDCKDRGTEYFSVPVENPEDYENDTVPEVVNHPDMGVSFKAWLERDPKKELENENDKDDLGLTLWWERNFYPHLDMIVNDLHKRGLLDAGEYGIEIDW